MSSKASRIPGEKERLRKHSLNLKQLEALIRLRDTARPVLPTKFSGGSPAGATGGGTGNFLPTAGGTMIGNIAFDPKLIAVSDGRVNLDPGGNPPENSTYILVTGQGSPDDIKFIDGAERNGQYLIYQGTNQQIQNLLNANLLNLDNIVGDGSTTVTVTLSDTGTLQNGDSINVIGTNNFDIVNTIIASLVVDTSFTYQITSPASTTPESSGVIQDGNIVTADGNTLVLDGTLSVLNAPIVTLVFDVTIGAFGSWRVVSTSSGSGGGGGPFLPIAGGTMLGPIGYDPDVVGVDSDGRVAITSSYMQSTGIGSPDDVFFFDGALFNGQQLEYQVANQTSQVIKNAVLKNIVNIVGTGIDNIITVTINDTSQLVTGDKVNVIGTNNFDINNATITVTGGTIFTYDLGSTGSTTSESAGVVQRGNIVMPDDADLTLDSTISTLGTAIGNFVFDPTILGTGWRLISSTVSGASGSQTPWLSNIDAAGFSLNNLLSLDVEDSAGATKLGISGPLGVGARFQFISGDDVIFTENITDRLKINADGLDVFAGDILQVDRLQLSGGTTSVTSVNDVVWYLDPSGDLISNVNVNDGWGWSVQNVLKASFIGGVFEVQDANSSSFSRIVNHISPVATGAIGAFELSADNIAATQLTMAFYAGSIVNTATGGSGSAQIGVAINGSQNDFIRINNANDGDITFLSNLAMGNNNITGVNQIAFNEANQTITDNTNGMRFSLPDATDTYDFTIDGNQTVSIEKFFLNLNNTRIQMENETVPSNAPANELFLFYSSVTGELSVIKDTGGAISLEGSGSGGATIALDNLASVAINTALLPDSADSISLGSDSLRWNAVYSRFHEFKNTDTLSAATGKNQIVGDQFGLQYTVTATSDFHTFMFNGASNFRIAEDEIEFRKSGRQHKIIAEGTALKLESEATNDSITLFPGSGRSNEAINCQNLQTKFLNNDSASRYEIQIVYTNATTTGQPAIGNLGFMADSSLNVESAYAGIVTAIDSDVSTARDGRMQIVVANADGAGASGIGQLTGVGMDIQSDAGVMKLGFFGVTPVARQSPAANAAEIISALEALGLFV